MTEPRIVTSYTYPVAPFPGFFQAWDDRLGADASPHGTGATEQEAIEDLLWQLEDKE